MKKFSIRLLVAFLFASALFYFGYKGYHNFYFSKTNKAITLRFRLVEDACGGCFPPWNVDSVFDRDGKYQNLLKKDIEIIYKGRRLEEQLKEQLNDIDGNCIVCSRFDVTGKVRKTISGKYKLMADIYTFVKDTACCNE